MNSSRRQFLARTAAGAAVIAGGSFTTAGPALGSPRALTALTGATVIDVVTGQRRNHQTVLIAGDRIVGVGRLPVPRGATVIDASGKYVVPARGHACPQPR
ncbi:twin-arginine translocation signal domain-containing protein [Kribbella sp. NBC_01505]|uniref:twin-arginine translocation signal domain-containing protein n=1 Tax=Kribbella sp. NBC_01505 TaxID=2903580 RepID=UPI0038652737